MARPVEISVTRHAHPRQPARREWDHYRLRIVRDGRRDRTAGMSSDQVNIMIGWLGRLLHDQGVAYFIRRETREEFDEKRRKKLPDE